MKCQSCGSEIADKAIVCYRCGAPTALPPVTRPERRPPVPAGSRPLGAAAMILIGLLVFAGVLTADAAAGWDESLRYGSEAAGLILAALGGWRLARRRG